MSVSKLSEELVKAGHTVSVLTTTANGKEELSFSTTKPVCIDGVQVQFYKRITKDHSHFSPGLLMGLYKLIKNKPKNGPSKNLHKPVVHIHAWWNLVSVLSCLIAVLVKIPVILSPRGTLSVYSFRNKNTFYKQLIHNLIAKPLLKRCHVHVTSMLEEKAFIQLLHPASITVIPNFVQLPLINNDQHIGRINFSAQNIKTSNLKPVTKSFKLLFLSRIEEKKGLIFYLMRWLTVKFPGA